MLSTINSTTSTTSTSQSNNSYSTTNNSSDNFANFLETSLKIDTSKKPNIKELMDFTNMSFQEASSILYGVIGSNNDTRDWNKILTSDNVLKTAKEETAKMYQSDKSFALASNSEEISSTNTQTSDINPITILADIQEGNVKFTQSSQFDEKSQTDVVSNTLNLTATNGILLRNAGNTPQQIVENLDAFGFDVEPLKILVTNEQIPDNVKTLLNDTISYYDNVINKSYVQSSTQSISTLDLLTNSLNLVDKAN